MVGLWACYLVSAGHICFVMMALQWPWLLKCYHVHAADPVYKYLKEKQGGMLFADIKWNFSKFLVDRSGNVVKRYDVWCFSDPLGPTRLSCLCMPISPKCCPLVITICQIIGLTARCNAGMAL